MVGNKLVKPKIEKVDCENFDSAVAAMIKNDNIILPKSNIAPTIWTCSWYNMSKTDAKKYNKLYKAGDAVWLNTEEPRSFAISNRSYIKSIVFSNSTLRKVYETVKDNESELIDFYVDIVNGKYTNVDNLPLYYIGDITKDVQIRVSLTDDNADVPTDDSTWIDFFEQTNQSKFQTIILNELSSLCRQYLETHMKEYHLSGISEYWYEKTGEIKTLSNYYLLNDMSNISKEQTFNITSGVKETGFDKVLFFTQNNFETDDCCKWFRVWNSGKLEYGGIVNIDEYGKLNDTKIGDQIYTVNFACYYGHIKSPSYTYSLDTTGFYYDGEKINIGRGNAIKMTSINHQIDQMNHYVVSLSPVMNSNVTPYATLNGGNCGYYVNKDVCEMTNSSFSFVIQPDIKYYSYYVVGYAKNVEQGFK